jgi:hypothetical protein
VRSREAAGVRRERVCHSGERSCVESPSTRRRAERTYQTTLVNTLLELLLAQTHRRLGHGDGVVLVEVLEEKEKA